MHPTHNDKGDEEDEAEEGVEEEPDEEGVEYPSCLEPVIIDDHRLQHHNNDDL